MQPMPAKDQDDVCRRANAEPAGAGSTHQAADEPGNSQRLREAFDQHFDYVWRLLRRLSVREAGVDDATQQVFLTLAAKLVQVQPGKERAFLTGTAFRIASNQRRSERRSFEEQHAAAIATAVDPSPDPEELLERRRQRAWLDHVLGQLPLELRAVLVLFELEGLSAPEIAELLEIPVGTVASRLRRARQHFLEAAEALRVRLSRNAEVSG